MDKKRNKVSRLDHPLHPIFTHFPMALLMTSLLWDIIGLWSGESIWWTMSYWSILVGIITAVFALITGLIELTKIAKGDPAESVAIRHMVVVLLAVGMFAGSFFFRYSSPVPSGFFLYGALFFSLIGLLLLLFGGMLGGELVYRHGVGRIKTNTEK